MSLETTPARDLSIPDLLRVLNEKLGLEQTRVRGTSLPPGVVSAASLESEIESLEARAQEILRFIPSLRNVLQRVNRLPPEIIARIARCSREHKAFDRKPIIPLTHVCRYWRESIISAPEIWTSVTDYPMRLWALSLERSKAAPVRLELNMWGISSRPGFCDLTGPNIQNTETLQFQELRGIEAFRQILPNFPQSMPNLRSLELWHENIDQDVGDDDGRPGWDLSTDPFGSFPKTLRSLSLHDIPLYPSFLGLRTLTELYLNYGKIHTPLDTILDFVEENRSLERVDLTVRFSPGRVSRLRGAIVNRLQHLSITSWDMETARTVVSSIPLRRGAHLGIVLMHGNEQGGLGDILSGISMTHLPNLPSPTVAKYQTLSRAIRLTGPNGSFSYSRWRSPAAPFTEFPVLPLTDVREFHLVNSKPSVVFHPSSLPALEVITVQSKTDVSHLLSALLANPSLPPSLKTLGFLDCDLSEDFMKELAQFASDRKKTASAWLRRVLIVHPDGKFPSAASVRALKKNVAIVDVRMDDGLPMDLL